MRRFKVIHLPSDAKIIDRIFDTLEEAEKLEGKKLMKWLTWLVSVSITVFVLHKGENVLGIWSLALTVVVFLSWEISSSYNRL